MVFFFPYFGGFAMTRSYTVYIANSKNNRHILLDMAVICCQDISPMLERRFEPSHPAKGW